MPFLLIIITTNAQIMENTGMIVMELLFPDAFTRNSTSSKSTECLNDCCLYVEGKSNEQKLHGNICCSYSPRKEFLKLITVSEE